MEWSGDEPLLGSRSRPQGVSLLATTTNLITGGLGAGILSLPWSMAGASIGVGVAIVAVALLINGWTIMILVEASEKVQEFDLGAILGRLPGKLGKRLQIIVDISIWISMFLCLVGYMIIVADSALQVVPHEGMMGQRWFWVLLGSAVVLPLCYVDQSFLAFTSTLSILVNIYLFALVAFQYAAPEMIGDTLEKPHNVCFVGFSRGSVTMFSAMTQAVAIQMCVLPMYKELDRRSVPRFRTALCTSFGFLFLLFSAFACLALLSVGPGVKGNYLLDLPSNGFGNAARLGMLIVVAGVYPIMVAPMVEPLRARVGKGRDADALCNATTAMIVLAAMVMSFFVKELGLMNVLNGAMAVGIFVGLCPALVGSMLLTRTGSWAWWHQALMALLLVFGLVMGCIGLVFLDNYVELMTPEHCILGQQDL